MSSLGEIYIRLQELKNKFREINDYPQLGAGALYHAIIIAAISVLN